MESMLLMMTNDKTESESQLCFFTGNLNESTILIGCGKCDNVSHGGLHLHATRTLRPSDTWRLKKIKNWLARIATNERGPLNQKVLMFSSRCGLLA